MTDKKPYTGKPRGFAVMDPEKRRAAASKGGKNSPSNFKNRPPEERRASGMKGGLGRNRNEV